MVALDAIAAQIGEAAPAAGIAAGPRVGATKGPRVADGDQAVDEIEQEDAEKRAARMV
jgi:hypothetical protein